MKKASMIDVAKVAGVSTATVGRVIHNNGSVKPETRAKVEAAIAELSYVPNQMARVLKSSKSRIIGSLFHYSPNGLFERMSQSIVDEAKRRNFNFLEIDARREDEETTIEQLIGMQIVGLVLIAKPGLSETMLQKLKLLNIPVVAIERGYDFPGVDNLILDDYGACYDVARRLAEYGHKRVGFISVEYRGNRLVNNKLSRVLDGSVEKRRHDGFVAGVKDFGLDDDPSLIDDLMQDGYIVEGGYAMMEKFLELDNPPTAVFALSDQIAAGAMQCLHKKGMKVPEDMSVIGYENLLAKYLVPQIDSVALEYNNIGEMVMSLLIDRMGNISMPSKTKYIDMKYVERGTLKKIY